MKVPYTVQSNVRPSHQALGYLNQDANTSGELIGRSVQRVAASLTAYSERMNKLNEFETLRRFSDWSRETAVHIDNVRRESPDNDNAYISLVNDMLNRRENEFLDSVPPEHQQEMAIRTTEVLNKFKLGELNFDRTRKDKFTIGKINEEVEKQKLDLTRDPSSMENRRKQLKEMAIHSGLPAATILAQNQIIDKELEKIGYAARYRAEQTAQFAEPGSIENFVNKVGGVESGGNVDAQNPNSSATGYGQFIESTWQQFMNERHPEMALTLDEAGVLALRKDKEFSREAIEWYAQKNSKVLAKAGIPATESNLYLAHFLGVKGAIAVFNTSAETDLAQVIDAKSYAANKFLQGKTAGWLMDWAAQKMGAAPAYAELDNDPAFSSLSLEERVALQNDVNQQLRATFGEQAKATERDRQNTINDLNVGLMDGQLGVADIQEARKKGILQSYEEINRAQGIYDKRNVEVADANYFNTKLNDPGAIFSLDDAKDKKAADSFWGKSGLNAIEAQDPNVLPQLVAIAERTGLVPPAAMNKLNALAQNRDWAKARYALDILNNIQRQTPDAFRRLTSDEEAAMVERYSLRQGLYADPQMQEFVQGGATPETRARVKALRSEANEILSNADYTNDWLLGQFTEYFRVGENTSVVPGLAATTLRSEFNTLFTDAYTRTGDEKAAATLAVKGLKRNWGFTNVGGNKNTLMKFPPEQLYSDNAGDYSYIDEQVRQMVSIPEGGSFQLVPDLQTALEVDQVRSRVEGALAPSYRVVTLDADGQYLGLDERRVFFEITDKMREKQYDYVDVLTARQALVDSHQTYGGHPVLTTAVVEQTRRLQEVYEAKKKAYETKYGIVTKPNLLYRDEPILEQQGAN